MGIFDKMKNAGDKLKDSVKKDLKSITDEGLKGNLWAANKNYMKTVVKYTTLGIVDMDKIGDKLGKSGGLTGTKEEILEKIEKSGLKEFIDNYPHFIALPYHTIQDWEDNLEKGVSFIPDLFAPKFGAYQRNLIITPDIIISQKNKEDVNKSTLGKVVKFAGKVGQIGDVEFFIDDIKSIMFEEGHGKGSLSGNGYIYFQVTGDTEGGGGLGAILEGKTQSPKQIQFPSDVSDMFKNCKGMLDKMIKTSRDLSKQPIVQQVVQQDSIPDQIKKLNELKELGAISEEEYDKKKTELLDKM